MEHIKLVQISMEIMCQAQTENITLCNDGIVIEYIFQLGCSSPTNFGPKVVVKVMVFMLFNPKTLILDASSQKISLFHVTRKKLWCRILKKIFVENNS